MKTLQRPTKTEAYDTIKILIDKYEAQKTVFLSANYNEARTRQDFIDRFFEALGWDMHNKLDELENHREVIVEDKLKIGKTTKSPDYLFQTHQGKAFYVEAKKPAIHLKTAPEPARQIREYGWNGDSPIGIATNFAELAIYDCTQTIKKTDGAMTKRLAYLAYTDYLAKFDFLWEKFAYENVVKGSVTAFIGEKINLKLAEPVNEVFLACLNKWREYLATNVAQRNKQLEEEEINFAVQLLIDRMVFLRVCEDRNVEPNEQLLQIAKSKGDTYQNLFELFKTADQKYNSGIFDLKRESITQNLDLDNKVIKNILKDLYNEDNDGVGRFNFAVIPIEILGYAYEQFLGKVIVLQKTGKAVIEDKPEVRKAGGVYYTPSYIVKYIVAETVGKAIEGKTPEEVSAISVLDPSCGSGSFLIGAYQFLLDWHLRYHLQNPPKIHKHKKENPLSPDGKHLTSIEKKRILLNNIYGVDIDKQAVEVTKLSLLLKALENETDASIKTSLQIFNERVLPTMDSNVQSGNSLIGADFYDQELGLTPKEERKINIFDWEDGFPNICKQGGFDCVIGNPPYVRTTTIDANSANYFAEKYKLATKQFDLYNIFIEKAFKILKKEGYFGYIVPSLFLKGVQYTDLRQLINHNSASCQIKEFGDKVFRDVSMPTCVFLITKGAGNTIDFFALNKHLFTKVPTIQLSSISKITRGLEIGRDKLFKAGHKKCITGGDIDSYKIKSVQYIDNQTYTEFNKSNIFEPDRVLVRETGGKFYSTIDKEGIMTTRSIYNVSLVQDTISTEFLQGLLGSKMYEFYFKEFIAPETNIFPKIRIAQLKELPVPKINFKDKESKVKHDNLSELVKKQYKLLEKLSTELETGLDQLKRRIRVNERNINQAVYELYNLIQSEIDLIENA